MKDTSTLSMATEESFPSLHELAANNDVEAFKRSIELDFSGIDEAGLWYVRKRGSKQIVLEERTPLTVAASYGSVDVLKLIVALPEVDLNRLCGQDKWTALHCAAFGGSINAYDAVKILLSAGADPTVEDACGLRPIDVIVVPPMLPGARTALEDLLVNSASNASAGDCSNLRVSVSASNVSSPVLSSSPDPFYQSDSEYSPMASKFNDVHPNSASEKKHYPVDPSLPDIRNGIYLTDEFRMYSFKVRPCSRAYSHDWTECPFVHPGENARRRDPRKFHYSCVPCPEFRKGACRRGDMCEYAHGVFECWLHPAQYRTRMCKDGTSCERQVCFFAHTPDELRPLYVSTGSGVPSPRSAASAAGFMDMAAALSLMPSSPTSIMPNPAAFNQTLSPTPNGLSHSSAPWPQMNAPALHLPGSNLQSSRLRSSISARDIPPEDLNLLCEIDADLTYFSPSHANLSMLSHSGRSQSALAPSNLEEMFSAETMSSSPRFSDQAGASGIFSPTHKAAVFNQFQQSNLPPVNTTTVFSPRNNADHSLLQASLGALSPRIMSPRSLEASAAASMSGGARLSASGLRGPVRSPVGSPGGAWSNWGSSSNRKVDWSVGGDDQDCLKRSPFGEPAGEIADPLWSRPLGREPPMEMAANRQAPAVSGECVKYSNSESELIDHSVLGAWLEQMQLDQLAVKLN
ncbi:zinc finger CCCH domain-containing protein 30-like [Andrographis paniculata]|uniref:zinc finger CCCH domain-containing protein 30-like n=1 Tax=Andrographis paniculata TaxID=175694 RepID=UPI0021E91330|nr:zinc finger CCCH domain-containing protein 30-like [Andrographis paniculata]XP_051123892.1 zinc finger CCCH domain-containing protein 30-like [Andrographis paniculata]